MKNLASLACVCMLATATMVGCLPPKRNPKESTDGTSGTAREVTGTVTEKHFGEGDNWSYAFVRVGNRVECWAIDRAHEGTVYGNIIVGNQQTFKVAESEEGGEVIADVDKVIESHETTKEEH